MQEWLNWHAWKVCRPFTGSPGFESPSFRQEVPRPFGWGTSWLMYEIRTSDFRKNLIGFGVANEAKESDEVISFGEWAEEAVHLPISPSFRQDKMRPLRGVFYFLAIGAKSGRISVSVLGYQACSSPDKLMVAYNCMISIILGRLGYVSGL